jgi:hypothetical protein
MPRDVNVQPDVDAGNTSALTKTCPNNVHTGSKSMRKYGVWGSRMSGLAQTAIGHESADASDDT